MKFLTLSFLFFHIFFVSIFYLTNESSRLIKTIQIYEKGKSGSERQKNTCVFWLWGKKDNKFLGIFL